MSWQTTLMMIILGISLALCCYQFYIGDTPTLTEELYTLKLKSIYILFMVGGFLLTFLKPKQEQQKLIEENNQNIELTDDEVLVQIYRKSANISMPMVEAFKAKIAEIDRIRVEEQSKKEELVRVEDAIETIKNAYQKAKEEMEEETLKSKDLHKNSISLTQQFKDCEKRIFHLENQKRVKFFEMLRHKEKIFTLEYYRQLKEIQLERDNFNSLIPSTLFV